MRAFFSSCMFSSRDVLKPVTNPERSISLRRSTPFSFWSWFVAAAHPRRVETKLQGERYPRDEEEAGEANERKRKAGDAKAPQRAGAVGHDEDIDVSSLRQIWTPLANPVGGIP